MAKSIGRPSKSPSQRKRRAVGLRTTDENYDYLGQLADASGRSMAQVLERLIERSREGDELVLAALYGPKFAAMLMLGGRIMSTAGRAALYAKTGSLRHLDEWQSDPYSFDQAAWAIEVLLDGLRPPGDPGFRRQEHSPSYGASRPEVIGPDLAAGLLYSLKNPDLPGASDTAEMLESRAYAVKMLEKLGEINVTIPPAINREDGHRRAAELRARTASTQDHKTGETRREARQERRSRLKAQ